MNKFSLVAFIFFMVSNCSHGQNNAKVIWTAKSPFEQKVFIENKGQYNIQDRVDSKDILYGARQGGLQYYFTANSIWIKRTLLVKRTEQELKDQIEEKKSHGGEDDDQESEYKYVDEFHEISFRDANSLAEITSDSEINESFNFTIKGKIPVKARAWEKLTYQNLYHGIDMEFYFPKDKDGFEYSFIVHPGADVSQIKMEYPLNKKIRNTPEGNIIIQSDFGEFTDHAPKALESISQKGINCSFILSNGVVQLDEGDYDKTQTLIIDPWVTTPTFTGLYNNAYDVDWDNAGNCYIYGGSFPYQLIKYNSSGNRIWSYTANSFESDYYGGFAVDRNSQSVYVIEAFDPNNGSQVIKLNALGIQVALWGGNPNMNEMWRIAFNRCTNQAVIAGGGTSAANQAAYLDTTLTNILPVNVLNVPGDNGYHDMWGITLDDYGNCYTACAKSGGASNAAPFNNMLLKFPLPTLVPTMWMVGDGYHFVEGRSVLFSGLSIVNASDSPQSWAIGFNGMAISDTDLFTYDSYTLKKWKSASGTAVDSIAVNTPNVDSTMYWGGLTSDDFGDIFLGSVNYVQQYNNNLFLRDVFPLPDTVYDVKLGSNNKLYTCGKNFVEVLHVILPSQQQFLNVNNATICAGTSAALVATGASTYQWTPSIGLNTTIGDSVIATPSITTTYTVIGSKSIGCYFSSDTVQSVVSVTQGINKPIITDTDNILTSSATEGNQWYRNGIPINGATNETYNAIDTGCYWLIATNIANGCSTTSDTICLTSLTGINRLSINNDQLSIYPNPTTGEIIVNINSSVGEVNDWSLQIIDVLGRTVYIKPSLDYNNDIDLSSFSNGVYFVTVINKTGRAIVPVVKQ